MARRITQKDIARELGVSRATVSYVLAGQARRHRVSPDTEKRVMDVAQRLHYVPNGIARSLRNQKTHTIGVILAGFESDWMQRLYSGIDEATEVAGYTPIIMARMWDAERERRDMDWLLERRVDGILVCIPIPENRGYYRRLIRQGFPIVFVGDNLPGLAKSCCVRWDSPAAVRKIVEHLVSVGRRRIAFCGVLHGTEMTIGRYDAYRAELEARGLEQHEEWTFWAPTMHADPMAMRNWLADLFRGRGPRPDAVFALNDAIAFSVMNELRQLGVDVPGEAAVAGLGNVTLVDEEIHRVTSVQEPVREYGSHGVAALLDLIEGRREGPLVDVISSERLLVRNTTVLNSEPAAV
jgi:DNA-binding LacI/PurR family transcriptional regulator